ncbi:MAG: HlyD family efflux transporter periplasmic adaptor subunit [Paucibacter sp.]|nr:HlyD family efflux transporter periplasmic adaptor subunit [Roseateles sp.]
MTHRRSTLLALLALAACSHSDNSSWPGYAFGDTLYITAPQTGRLAELRVESGQQVSAGALLFSLDATYERAAEGEAAARAVSAHAQALDADKGRRAAEVAMAEAQLREAEKQAELARSELRRRRELLAQGFIARAEVDDGELQLQQAEAHVHELRAGVDVAHLPSRDDQRAAAHALAAAASSSVAETAWLREQMTQNAPSAGRITDIYYRPGEWVPAGQPVLALLPPANRKARFFVAESQLGAIQLGQRVGLSCDGCGAAIPARISYIAPQAEYTPPVIYSNSERAKLVFMVEARPEAPVDAERLHPGQPLEVRAAP